MTRPRAKRPITQRPPRLKPCAICFVSIAPDLLDDHGRCQSCAGQLALDLEYELPTP